MSLLSSNWTLANILLGTPPMASSYFHTYFMGQSFATVHRSSLEKFLHKIFTGLLPQGSQAVWKLVILSVGNHIQTLHQWCNECSCSLHLLLLWLLLIFNEGGPFASPRLFPLNQWQASLEPQNPPCIPRSPHSSGICLLAWIRDLDLDQWPLVQSVIFRGH